MRGLYTRLTQDGVDAWLDKAKLLPGQDWELEIRKAVREADVVVVCLSKQFNQAGFRQKEVRLALDTAMEKPEGEIFIIPARLEECDNLESLRRWHWVDLFEDDGYEMLLSALRVRANRIGVIAQAASKLAEKDEQDKRLKILQRHARSLEESGNLEGALKVYLEIENINPFIAGIEHKILELQGKIRVNQRLLDLIKSTENKKRTTTSKTKLSKSGAARFAGAVSIVFFLFAIFAASRIPSLIKEINLTSTSSNLITPTISSTLIVSETPLPTEITDAKGVSMLLVPAGEFMMGSDNGYSNEKPVHQVDLGAFYMDAYEVTNARYKVCEEVGVCDPPEILSSKKRSTYYVNGLYSNYPVINVNWDMAKTYCEWRDMQLPTEAQWEKAAKGTDGRTYPWGEGFSCDKANYQRCIGDTVAVGSYESDKSPYGIYDMAGNVTEWVADWYSETYYQDAPLSNPFGPNSGIDRVYRGGSWVDYENVMRTSVRLRGDPANSNDNLGFRCVSDTNP